LIVLKGVFPADPSPDLMLLLKVVRFLLKTLLLFPLFLTAVYLLPDTFHLFLLLLTVLSAGGNLAAVNTLFNSNKLHV
jgi:hypothetical protein